MADTFQEITKTKRTSSTSGGGGEIPTGTYFAITQLLGEISTANQNTAIGNLGITATKTELNILDGATLSTTELNYVAGVTSSIQTQLDNKQPLDAELTTLSGLSSGQASDLVAITEAEYTQIQNINAVTISNTQWGYLGTLASPILEDNDIGSTVQAWDTQLDTLSGMSSAQATGLVGTSGTATFNDIDTDTASIGSISISSITIANPSGGLFIEGINFNDKTIAGESGLPITITSLVNADGGINVNSNLVINTSGEITSGSITSGFGSIDIGTSTLDAGVTTVSQLDIGTTGHGFDSSGNVSGLSASIQDLSITQETGEIEGQDILFENTQGTNNQQLKILDGAGNQGGIKGSWSNDSGVSWNEIFRFQGLGSSISTGLNISGDVGLQTTSPQFGLDFAGATARIRNNTTTTNALSSLYFTVTTNNDSDKDFSSFVAGKRVSSTENALVLGSWGVGDLEAAERVVISGNGIDITSGGLLINSTSVIDSSRNFFGVEGTFSGDLTAEANLILTTGDIETSDFSDWFSATPAGWQISQNGTGDFRTLYIDELIAKAFTVDVAQALAGSDILTKSVSLISRDFTVPAVSSSDTIYVEDLPGLDGFQVFEANDWVRLRVVDRTSGLTIADVYGQVTSYTDLSDGEQSWTFTTRYAGTADVLVGETLNKGALVLDYGTSGDYYIERTVLDRSSGTDFTKVPYDRIVQWTNTVSGSPRPSDPDTNITVVTQSGNLSNLTSTYANVSGFGYFSENAFLTGDLLVGDLSKAGSYLEYTGGSLTANLDTLEIETSTFYVDSTSYIALGASAPTQRLAIGVGFYADTDGDLRIGDASGNNVTFVQSTGSLTADLSSLEIDATEVYISSSNQRIGVGADGSAVTVANTTAGTVMEDTGFKSYLDSDNYIRRDGTSLDIRANNFQLVAGNLEIDSSEPSINIKKTYNSTDYDVVKIGDFASTTPNPVWIDIGDWFSEGSGVNNAEFDSTSDVKFYTITSDVNESKQRSIDCRIYIPPDESGNSYTISPSFRLIVQGFDTNYGFADYPASTTGWETISNSPLYLTSDLGGDLDYPAYGGGTPQDAFAVTRTVTLPTDLLFTPSPKYTAYRICVINESQDGTDWGVLSVGYEELKFFNRINSNLNSSQKIEILNNVRIYANGELDTYVDLVLEKSDRFDGSSSNEKLKLVGYFTNEGSYLDEEIIAEFNI